MRNLIEQVVSDRQKKEAIQRKASTDPYHLIKELKQELKDMPKSGMTPQEMASLLRKQRKLKRCMKLWLENGSLGKDGNITSSPDNSPVGHRPTRQRVTKP
jgi:hypothetical protein